MPRTGTKATEAGTAIKELLALPVVRNGVTGGDLDAADRALIAMNDVKTADQVEQLLDDRSVQALFDALPAHQWVSTEVAAAYCQCSALAMQINSPAQDAAIAQVIRRIQLGV
jgi:hypothetical protein